MAEKKSPMSVSEAGHRGGEKTAQTHGHEFFEEIGHKGGQAGGHKGGQRVRQLIEEGKKSERGA
jgi:general stress protein YciG